MFKFCTRLLQGVVVRLKAHNRANLPKNRFIQNCKASKKALTMDTVNPNIVKLQYAVRGPLVIRATEIQKEINEGVKKPFETVIRANLGDAHAMGQKPITFIRQVMACVSFPELIEKYDFPSDVKERACAIIGACLGHSVGSYTVSWGIEMIRRHVADYIEQRDGHPANWQDVVLTAGASPAIKYILQLLCKDMCGKKSGCMIPIPQYPLYSAALDEFALCLVKYYLDEDSGWALHEAELERALKEGSENCNVRAIVVINPGNPTGQVLSRENIEVVIKFAHRHNLMLMSDEVYQENIYAECGKFYSFKKILKDLGAPFADEVELVSFMSISKGYTGECGIRGGWMELVNFDKDVQANLYKGISANLCPTTIGQTVVDIVSKVPREGEPSYDLFMKEKTAVLTSLKKRAKMCADAFNSIEGFKCNDVQGAMYAFPRIELPKKAIEEAKKAGKPADVFYAFKLLEETGVCIVPGSGFGQRPGTYHFRTTILPQHALLQKMLDIFKSFHQKFTKEYS